ncbi:hypothetical protein [Burkholderia dolosa]|uniref:hypothetical protein n=1 Tax=Burkholderia dolosa TaxID=152500 RepID=UPI001591C22A|nr:hypothetical protein [Burkholderia dolosa]MBR8057343.1 hypothetical protein [Burkholderia dolosa]
MTVDKHRVGNVAAETAGTAGDQPNFFVMHVELPSLSIGVPAFRHSGVSFSARREIGF